MRGAQTIRSLILGSMVVLAGSFAGGATFTVDSTADATDASPGDGVCATAASACTLRAAVEEANALAGADEVMVPAGVYVLADLVTVTGDLTVSGAGAAATFLDGNHASRLLQINAGATVELVDLCLRNASASGYPAAVDNKGTTTIRRCAITGNSNTTGGGAIWNSGDMTILESELSGNHSGSSGGAVYSRGSTLTVANSTVSGNDADAAGGGFSINNGTVHLFYTTVTDNTADADQDGAGGGGGLYMYGGTVTVEGVVMAANSDRSERGEDCWIEDGEVLSDGHNLIGDTTGFTLGGDGVGDLVGVAAVLGPLADNGGSTRTHALLPGSPAIDAAPSASCPASDQRGEARPADGNDDGNAVCDIGAFELQRAGGPLAGPALYVAGTANLKGYGGIQWRTDLEVHSRGATQATYVVALLERGKANPSPQQRTYTLDPGKGVRYNNALSEIFDFSGAATLRITQVAGELAVTSRTYVDGPGGTLGQYVPAHRVDRALAFGDEGLLIQLTQSAGDDAGYRTNLGVVNASATTMEVKVELFKSDGTSLGVLTLSLRPFESIQKDKVFRLVTSDEVDDGHAVVWTTTEGGLFFAFASVVDNRSTDSIFIPVL